jgi:hypothetical protein
VDLKAANALMPIAAFIAQPQTVWAQEVLNNFSFNGHNFEIVQNAETFEQELRYQGNVLISEYYISVEEKPYTQEVMGVLLSAGGNACPEYPALLQAPVGQPPAVFALPNECKGFDIAPTEAGIFLSYTPSIGLEAPSYLWKPESGLIFKAMIAFSPNPDLNWQSLQTSTPTHPIEALKNQDLYFAARDMMGGHMLADFARAISVASAPVREADLIFTRGCYPHQCDSADSLMVVDVTNQKLYAAMNDFGTPRSWPTEVASWPAAVRNIIKRNY